MNKVWRIWTSAVLIKNVMLCMYMLLKVFHAFIFRVQIGQVVTVDKDIHCRKKG